MMRFTWLLSDMTGSPSFRLRLLLVATVLLAACAPVTGARDSTINASSTETCLAALDSLETVFRRDYPGYRDKVSGREAALAALTDSVRAVARTSNDHGICIPALWRFTEFFSDPHVMLWQAAAPSPTGVSTAGRTQSSQAEEDPNRPSLRFVDDSTAVLVLPDLDVSYRTVVDSLIAANRARILATPYLVVDVRGNGGGCSCSFDAFIPFLYTGPIARYGVDLWASAANVAHFRSMLDIEELPEETKQQIRSVLPVAEANLNRFVTLYDSRETVMDTIYPLPRRVGVLVDGGCASSCEDLVIAAMQSQKAIVVGKTNTGGVLDYGEVRSTWLPGWRRLRIPTTRSRRMLDVGPIDNVGIEPDVVIPEGELDPLAFVLRALRSENQQR